MDIAELPSDRPLTASLALVQQLRIPPSKGQVFLSPLKNASLEKTCWPAQGPFRCTFHFHAAICINTAIKLLCARVLSEPRSGREEQRVEQAPLLPFACAVETIGELDTTLGKHTCGAHWTVSGSPRSRGRPGFFHLDSKPRLRAGGRRARAQFGRVRERHLRARRDAPPARPPRVDLALSTATLGAQRYFTGLRGLGREFPPGFLAGALPEPRL